MNMTARICGRSTAVVAKVSPASEAFRGLYKRGLVTIHTRPVLKASPKRLPKVWKEANSSWKASHGCANPSSSLAHDRFQSGLRSKASKCIRQSSAKLFLNSPRQAQTLDGSLWLLAVSTELRAKRVLHAR